MSEETATEQAHSTGSGQAGGTEGTKRDRGKTRHE